MEIVRQIAIGGLDDNFSYIVTDGEGTDCAVVDPAGTLEHIFSAIEEQNLVPRAIWITHSHFDHVEGVPAVLARYPELTVYAHEGARLSVVPNEALRQVGDGATVMLGENSWQVLYTPGHINDAICFFLPAGEARDGVPKLISGDTLFVERVGRTSAVAVDELYDSIERLRTLPEETRVYPGHDYGRSPTATLGWIKANNPYLLCESREAFRELRLGS